MYLKIPLLVFEIYSNIFKHVIWYFATPPWHRVDKTYRDVTDRCKHCGRLRYHVPTFFQATGGKMINCACSASLKWVVIRSSSNQMHASSNLPSMRTKKVGTLVTSLYVSTLCPWAINFCRVKWPDNTRVFPKKTLGTRMAERVQNWKYSDICITTILVHDMFLCLSNMNRENIFVFFRL
jgi:hypothetical protein